MDKHASLAGKTHTSSERMHFTAGTRDSQRALSSPSVSAMRRWRSHRDRCELASESPSAPGIWLRHPWEADAHLEGIRGGIDAAPGVMKNELSCCDVNTNDLSHDAFA